MLIPYFMEDIALFRYLISLSLNYLVLIWRCLIISNFFIVFFCIMKIIEETIDSIYLVIILYVTETPEL